MAQSSKQLSADQAIDIAFELFEKYVARGKSLQNVLLEELEPKNGGWVVSIGFDGSRKERSEPASIGSLAALGGFGNVTTTTVREIRHFYLDENGEFSKMA